jgi:hypothetical protein
MKRRDFVKISAVCGLGLSVSPAISQPTLASDDTKPKTNIEEALKYPRTQNSLPESIPERLFGLITLKQ